MCLWCAGVQDMSSGEQQQPWYTASPAVAPSPSNAAATESVPAASPADYQWAEASSPPLQVCVGTATTRLRVARPVIAEQIAAARCFALSRPHRRLGCLLMCISTSGEQISAVWRTSAATLCHNKHTVHDFVALSSDSQAVKQQERNEKLVSCKAGCSASCLLTV